METSGCLVVPQGCERPWSNLDKHFSHTGPELSLGQPVSMSPEQGTEDTNICVPETMVLGF
jgi:hypothetical protein